MKKHIMKKIFIAVFAAVLAAASLTGCSDNDEKGKQKQITIAIVQPMSHTSLDQIRETIISELNAAGRTNIKIVTSNANNDTSALTTILSNHQIDGVDIVIPIATSTAQSAKTVFEGTTTPIIFAAVSNPTAAGLTGDGCQYITGVSNNIPSDEIVKLIAHFQEDYKKIGFVYTSSEVNSVSTINAAKAYCDENNISYEEASISNLSELQTAVESLISKGVDALYTGNDNTIASAMATYTDIAYSHGIPVYCGADSMVADGGFATVGVDYVQLGKQVAAMVLKIIDGESVSAIPYETLNEYARFVNLKAAKTLGITMDESKLEGFEVLVEEDGTSHFGE
ncbi:MAG: ABC transporter substrate-binding protein [Eubacteriales bacterium]|nr:ABC transporter substrate-binding protein [Eubacteriales bacterium]